MVSGLGVAYVTGGLIFVWAGYQNITLSDTIKGFLSGKVPKGTPTGSPSIGLSQVGSMSSQGQAAQQFLGSGATGGTPAKNQAIARVLAAPYGWSAGTEWNDLVNLWNRESGWSNTAKNPSSGAYGIPQALPASKMGSAANPPTSSATAQISWGLGYIKSTYGSPTAAWAHEESAGWY